jgi:hypothetical protein
MPGRIGFQALQALKPGEKLKKMAISSQKTHLKRLIILNPRTGS